MPLIFNCPACGKELSAPDAAAGAVGACKFCQASIIAPTVPGGSAAVASGGPPPGAQTPGPTPPEPPFGQSSYSPPGAGYTPPGSGYPPPGGGFPPTNYGSPTSNLAEIWKRIVAYLIDGILIGLVSTAVTWPFRASGYAAQTPEETLRAMGSSGIGSLISWLIFVAYGGFMESTKGATLGKMAMKLRVTDMNGSQIDLGKAVLRNVVKQLTGFCCFLYFVFFFTPLRQALHDMAAATLVVED